MTGPIHTIQSLEQILKKYNQFKKSVINNKKRMLLKFKKYLVYSKKNQPLLCTFVNKKIVSKNKNVILYKPRLNINGSVGVLPCSHDVGDSPPTSPLSFCFLAPFCIETPHRGVR